MNVFPIGRIFLLILQGLPSSLLNPFFWVVVFIVWSQYRRTAQLEIELFGKEKASPLDKTLCSVLYGILGGILGSVIVMVLGVSITEAGLVYVWPLALLLAIVDPHLMCFSYAGGIVSLFVLLTGLLRIDVAGLMALVAVLHFVESILIFFAGHMNATPVFVRDERYGIIGGFSMQEFWPVPIMLLTIITGNFPPMDVVQMPDWWPLIKPPSHILQSDQAIYLMLPVVAALGYGELALSRMPKHRCRLSSLNLLLFSSALLFLSILASRYRPFAYIAAIFAPAAHEFLIISTKKTERSRRPIFIAHEKGEMVLDVVKNSPAEKCGLETGDIILSANGRDLDEPGWFQELLSTYPTFLWMKVLEPEGNIREVEINAFPRGINDIGAILVPRNRSESYVVLENKSLLKRLKDLFNKRKT